VKMEERHTLLLPDWVWSAIDRVAEERRCSATDLLGEQAICLLSDTDFLFRVDSSINEIMSLRYAGQADAAAWPKDPLEALAVGYRMSLYFAQAMERELLSMDEERLAFWDRETKRTGLSIEELTRDRIFEPQDAIDREKRDDADWWKKDAR
jgi:hypothetical protein